MKTKKIYFCLFCIVVICLVCAGCAVPEGYKKYDEPVPITAGYPNDDTYHLYYQFDSENPENYYINKIYFLFNEERYYLLSNEEYCSPGYSFGAEFSIYKEIESNNVYKVGTFTENKKDGSYSVTHAFGFVFLEEQYLYFCTTGIGNIFYYLSIKSRQKQWKITFACQIHSHPHCMFISYNILLNSLVRFNSPQSSWANRV